MKTGRKILRFTLIALLLVALSVSVFLLLPKSNSAAAANEVIGELYNKENNTFNKEELDKLYTALGSTTGYAGVKSNADLKKANPTTQGNGYKNYGDTTVAAKEISVTFGGKQWLAVYLSESDSNDVVLT